MFWAYALGHNVTTLTYGALCRGLLSGAMHADRQFSHRRLAQEQRSQVFSNLIFAEYLDAASKLDAYAPASTLASA